MEKPVLKRPLRLDIFLGCVLAVCASASATWEALSAPVVLSQVPGAGRYGCFEDRLLKGSPAANSARSDAASTIVVRIDGTQHATVERGEITMTADGCTLTGIVQETGESAMLMWWKDGRLTGTLGYRGHIYTVMNVGGEAHAEIEVGPRTLPASGHTSLRDNHVAVRSEGKIKQWPPQPASATPVVTPFSDAERLALEAKKVTIDLMLLYTRKAANRYIINLADLMAQAVEQTNQSFRNSGLGNIQLRLVHAQQIDYDEREGEHFEHLYRLVDGVGPFKMARRLRNEKRADIVGMILDDPSSCGLSTRIAPDSEEAFFVVHHSCAAIALSIPHEIGHILGARHDRQADASNAPFLFGHGYVNGNKWRDIMGYHESCGGCPRIPYWSNPRIKYRGEPTGTDASDNARVILGQAERVSNFR